MSEYGFARWTILTGDTSSSLVLSPVVLAREDRSIPFLSGVRPPSPPPGALGRGCESRPNSEPSMPPWGKTCEPPDGLVSRLTELEANSRFSEDPAPLPPSKGSSACGNPFARRIRDGLCDGGCSGKSCGFVSGEDVPAGVRVF